MPHHPPTVSPVRIAALIAVALLLGAGGYLLLTREAVVTGTVSAPVQRVAAQALAARTALLLGGTAHPVSGASESMGSAVSARAFVVLLPRWDDLEPGHVIAFEGPDGAVLHRAVYSKNGRWLTSGDANRRSDQVWIGPDEYLGTLVAQFYFME